MGEIMRASGGGWMHAAFLVPSEIEPRKKRWFHRTVYRSARGNHERQGPRGCIDSGGRLSGGGDSETVTGLDLPSPSPLGKNQVEVQMGAPMVRKRLLTWLSRGHGINNWRIYLPRAKYADLIHAMLTLIVRDGTVGADCEALVKQFNPFEFYTLATVLHPLVELPNGTWGTLFLQLWTAKSSVYKLTTGDPLPPGGWTGRRLNCGGILRTLSKTTTRNGKRKTNRSQSGRSD